MEHLSQTERLKALAALVTAVVLFASAFVAIRAIVAAGSYSPGQLVLARMSVAAACLVVLAVARGGVRIPRGRDWIAFFVLGGLGQAAYQLLLNTGQRTVDAGTAALLVSLSPILASIMAVAFLGERLTWAGWAGTGIAFTGAGIIAASAGVSLHMEPGVLLVMGATVFWATYQVVQKTVCDGYSPLELTAWPTWIAVALLLPFFGASTLQSAVAAPASATLGVVWLGAMSSVGGFLAWSYAVKRLPVVVFSNALFAVPVAAFVIALVLLGEVPDPLAFVGGAVVIAGVVLAQTKGRPARVAVPAEATEAA